MSPLNASLRPFLQSHLRQIIISARNYGSPGQSQRHKKSTHRGLKVMPGTWVNERAILATQLKLDYHPGLNCGLDPRDLSIFSLRAGKVFVSTEFSESEGQRFKRHVNVIPDEPGVTFRLIDLV